MQEHLESIALFVLSGWIGDDQENTHSNNAAGGELSIDVTDSDHTQGLHKSSLPGSNNANQDLHFCRACGQHFESTSEKVDPLCQICGNRVANEVMLEETTSNYPESGVEGDGTEENDYHGAENSDITKWVLGSAAGNVPTDGTGVMNNAVESREEVSRSSTQETLEEIP